MNPASLYPGQDILVWMTLALKDKLLSLALNQNVPRMLLHPVLPVKCDLARSNSSKGVLPVAVSDGSTA